MIFLYLLSPLGRSLSLQVQLRPIGLFVEMSISLYLFVIAPFGLSSNCSAAAFAGKTRLMMSTYSSGDGNFVFKTNELSR